MRRRDLILATGAAFALARAARAQKPAAATIGLLSPFTRAGTEPWHQAFRQGLRELGWVEGENVRYEYRYADGHNERLSALADELVKLKPNAIVVSVNSDAIPAAKATKTIPIVMVAAGDPVATGLIASLGHPGGNVTGMTQMATDLAAKRLQLLKEVAPGISRVAVLWDPSGPVSSLAWQEIQEPARHLAIELHSLEVRSPDQLDAALASATGAHDSALMPLPGPVFVVDQKRIADFAVVNRLPSVFHLPEFVRAGGLLSYGPDRADLFRRAATYVDKILKGASPGDLPVQQPTKFELAINLKTAKALALTVPPLMLANADEVIE